MYEVSDRFKELAQANGRRVFCRIEAGQEVFLDDRITEFDFDDVAHPDWFTIGTTCANRFSFSVRYSGELGLHDTVRPYISFDGEEWCPLGVFLIARRYIRGQYATIICYDKLYSLDMEYRTEITAPTDTAALLRDICTRYGLECSDFGFENKVTAIPTGCTVRDMIGYIAAMNRADARIDRNGALVLRQFGYKGFILPEKNCLSIRRNMAHSVFTCIKADTGEETLICGSGAEISTLELYNPLMTEKKLEELYKYFRSFSFYGAEIEMQGLPYIEAGDTITLEDKGLLYQIVVSEIEYHYDGSLYATLYSKNRAYTDAAVHMDDLKKALEELKALLSAACQKYTNETALSLSDEPVKAAEFELDCAVSGFAQLVVGFNAKSTGAAEITAQAYVNDKLCDYSAKFATAQGKTDNVTYSLLADNLPAGKNRIFVTLSAAGGAEIAKNGLFAYVIGHGFAGGGQTRDKLLFFEQLSGVQMGSVNLRLAALTAELTLEEE